MAVGTSQRRLEGAGKVTGRTTFTEDLPMSGVLHGRLVLSTEASADIESIDASAAIELPGVAALTGADLVPASSGPDAPLAVGRVHWAGQPVALVLADDPATAADAAALVSVEFRRRQVVADARAAMAADAPAVLDTDVAGMVDAATHGGGGEGPEETHTEDLPGNVTALNRSSRGDAAAGLAASDVVVKASYHVAGVTHGFIEPHVVIARAEPDGGVTVWTPTQGVFLCRTQVAERTGLPDSRVRIVPMAVGGGFGGKIVLLEPLAALASMRTGRPVRLALTRSEEFLVGRPAPSCSVEIELGAGSDGQLLALRARTTFDNGATAGWHTGLGATFLSGTYRIPNVDLAGYEVATHRPPVDAYRAPAAPQLYFALESAMDELARQLGIDPFELRLLNASREGDVMVERRRWPRIGLVECLEAARRHPLYSSPTGPDEGIGIAVGGWGGAFGPAGAGCRLEQDGTLVVQVGTVDISGTDTGLALLAAETFGVPVDRVRVEHGDSGTAPHGPTAGGSAVSYSTGPAVVAAAAEARGQALEIAAEHMEAAPEDLELSDGAIGVRGVPARMLALDELGRLTTQFAGAHPPVHGFGRTTVDGQSPMFTVHIARVRVDRETGAFQVTGYAAIQDVGRALNPAEIEGQVHGGAAQGLGRALGEQLVVDADGQLRTGSFLDYPLPTADLVPNIDVQLVEVPSPSGPMGARGVGEPPAVPGPAAVANAIAAASGVRVRRVPIPHEALISPLAKPSLALAEGDRGRA
jgi:CO/xanthine dehydrogenase Mo-binding subunit